jgi:MFS family permease
LIDRVNEFTKGWPIVLVSVIGMMLGISALPFYTLGVFAKPIIQEFGWSRGQYQGAFVAMLIGAATAPLVGYLCDRFGVRRVALVSMAGFALGLAGIGLLTTHAIVSFYFAWLALAVLGQGTGPLAWTRVIGEWFSTQRGLALGFALMGSGITAFVAPPVATALIAAVGWRHTYLILAAVVILVGWPVVWFMLHDRAPLQTVLPQATAVAPVASRLDSSLRLAVKNYRFWIIAFSFFVFAFGIAGIISNLIPLLTDGGLAPSQAAKYASTIGLSVIGGRVIVGYLMDRLWAPAVAFVVLALPALSCLILSHSTASPVGTAGALVIVGFAAGAEFDMMAYLVSRYFGLTHYGKIYGVQYAIFFLGAAIAPTMFGGSYDAHRSYAFILGWVAGATLLAAALLLCLGRYPQLIEESPESAHNARTE